MIPSPRNYHNFCQLCILRSDSVDAEQSDIDALLGDIEKAIAGFRVSVGTF